MERFESLEEVIEPSSEARTLEKIYDVMSRRKFTSHLLQPVPERVGVFEMQDMIWSHWGIPSACWKRFVLLMKQSGFLATVIRLTRCHQERDN